MINCHTPKTFLTFLNSITILRNLFKGLDHEEWKNDMRVEMEALEKNKTWKLVQMLKGRV